MNSLGEYPRFIVAGMYRSGSTKLFNILRSALENQNFVLRSGHYPVMQDFVDVAKKEGAFLLKQHELPDEIISLIRQGDISVVLTIRNPMEALVSLCSAFGYSPEEAVSATENAILSAEQVCEFAHVFHYKTATSSNPLTIRRYLGLLEISASPFELARLSYQYNKRNSRSISKSVPGTSRTSWDEETLFHPGHISGERRVDKETMNVLKAAISDRKFVERFHNLENFAI